MSKKLALEVLKSLPEDVSVDDFLEALYLRMKVQKALKDIQENKVVSSQELLKEIKQWK